MEIWRESEQGVTVVNADEHLSHVLPNTEKNL